MKDEYILLYEKDPENGRYTALTFKTKDKLVEFLRGVTWGEMEHIYIFETGWVPTQRADTWLENNGLTETVTRWIE